MEYRCICKPIRKIKHEKFIYEGGVFGADGEVIYDSLLKRANNSIQTLEIDSYKAKIIKGKFFFGGLIVLHYGHFITETLSKLYKWDADKYDGVVFFSADKVSSFDDLPAWAKEILAVFNINLSNSHVVKEYEEYESLSIVESGFELNGYFFEEHRDYLQRMIYDYYDLSDSPVSEDSKLYISRSYFSKGVVAGESFLEEILNKQGYDVFYPERNSFEDQIKKIHSSVQLCGVAGSGLHTLMFLDCSKKGIAVIQRRGLENSTQKMINRSVGISSVSINSIIGVSHNDSRTATHIDMKILLDKLYEKGFIYAVPSVPNLFMKEFELLSKFEDCRTKINSISNGKLVAEELFNEENVLRELSIVRPNLATVHFLLARIFFSRRECLRAFESIDRALSISPTEYQYLRLKADIYRYEKNYIKSLEVVDEIAEGSCSPDLYLLKAILFFSLKDDYSSFKSIQMCLNVDNSYPGANAFLDKLKKRMKKKLVIHVGPHKTGTTTIQNGLVINDALFKDNGVNVVSSKNIKNINRFHHEIAWYFLEDSRCSIDEKDFIDFIDSVLASNCNRSIVSSEDFSLLNPQQISSLKEKIETNSFGLVDVEIVFVLRNPLAILVSMYDGRLDVFGLEFEDFCKQRISTDIRLNPEALISRWGVFFNKLKIVFFEEIKRNLFKCFSNTVFDEKIPEAKLVIPSKKNISRGPAFHKMAKELVLMMSESSKTESHGFMQSARMLRLLVDVQNFNGGDYFIKSAHRYTVDDKYSELINQRFINLEKVGKVVGFIVPESYVALPGNVIFSDIDNHASLVENHVNEKNILYKHYLLGFIEYVFYLFDKSEKINFINNLSASSNRKTKSDCLKITKILRSKGLKKEADELEEKIKSL